MPILGKALHNPSLTAIHSGHAFQRFKTYLSGLSELKSLNRFPPVFIERRPLVKEI